MSRYRPLWLVAVLLLVPLCHLTLAAPAAPDSLKSNATKVEAPTPVHTRTVESTGDDSSEEESAADDVHAEADVDKQMKTRSYDSGGSSSGSYGGSSGGSSYGGEKQEYATNSYDQEYVDYDKDTYKVGGYGKSTVLKGVKHKVVPWVREGVQYIPKKFYIYGQVHTKTPYYKKITTSVQHLGPGKTKLYKETTGVEQGEIVNKALPYVDKSSKYWTAATNYNTEEDNSYDTGDSSYGGSSGGGGSYDNKQSSSSSY